MAQSRRCRRPRAEGWTTHRPRRSTDTEFELAPRFPCECVQRSSAFDFKEDTRAVASLRQVPKADPMCKGPLALTTIGILAYASPVRAKKNLQPVRLRLGETGQLVSAVLGYGVFSSSGVSSWCAPVAQLDRSARPPDAHLLALVSAESCDDDYKFSTLTCRSPLGRWCRYLLPKTVQLVSPWLRQQLLKLRPVV